MSNLKPCPFCGHDSARIISRFHGLEKFFRIECMVCGIRTQELPALNDPDAAKMTVIQMWQRRE